jgi:hypothetical protein
MEHQEKVAFAVSILIDAETLQQCDLCDSEVIADSDDVQAAYRLANSRWTDGRHDYSKAFRSRREMTDCIKEAYENNCGDECSHCAHMLAD